MRHAVALLALPALLPGCQMLYRHTTTPATNDFNATPIVSEIPSSLNVKRIKYSWWLDVQWDSNAIGDIAKAHGISPVYYADVEELQILFVWNQTWLIVYGESASGEEGSGEEGTGIAPREITPARSGVRAARS